VVGALESSEFLRQSRIIAEAWSKSGVQAGYQEIVGTNHFTVLDPLSDPRSAMTRRLAELVPAV
jgi:arylformamidase